MHQKWHYYLVACQIQIWPKNKPPFSLGSNNHTFQLHSSISFPSATLPQISLYEVLSAFTITYGNELHPNKLQCPVSSLNIHQHPYLSITFTKPDKPLYCKKHNIEKEVILVACYLPENSLRSQWNPEKYFTSDAASRGICLPPLGIILEGT